MRNVSPDLGHIDYIYQHSAEMRIGIRVRPGRANIIQSDGNDLERMVTVDGTNAVIPIPALPAEGMAVFPSVPFARDEYMDRYPESDLEDVLSGDKSFKDALRDVVDN